MRRLDVHELLTGRGTFVDDVNFKGYYGVFVRSPYPHAYVKRIDYSDATKRGALVLTGRDMLVSKGGEEDREGSALSSTPLAIKKVRYVGEPVIFVMAKDLYEAMDLAETVQVDYEEIQPVNDIDEALGGESLVFEELGTNLVGNKVFEFGSIPRDKEVDLELYWSRSSGNPMENFGVVAFPEKWGVRLIANMQAPNFLAKEISKALNLKVIAEPIRQGGSFGAKFSLLNYATIVTFASWKFKVPVKWIETRSEHLVASGSSGPERKFKVRATFLSDGTVTGLDVKVWEDLGASTSGGQAFKPTGILAGPYSVRNIRYEVNLVATNKNPPGAFRGAGTPPHTWALERVMDAVADELKMRREEVRQRNLIKSFPYEAPYALYDSGNPGELMRMALSRSDIFSLREKGYGVGIACSTDPSTPSGQEEVRLSVKEGKVVVGIGYGPEGQGNEHTAIKLTSELLGVPTDVVSVETLDSSTMSSSFGPGGSRMAVFMAGAIRGATEELVRRIRVRLERETGDSVSYRNGVFLLEKERKEIPLTQINENASYTFSLHGKSRFNAYPFAVDLAVVKMDQETGMIRPVKHVVYIDPGTPIDEDLVKEQVTGGTYIGISIALYESYRYQDGRPLVASLSDYNMPTAVEIPDIEVNLVPYPSPYTPMGAKGIGEIPVGVAAAAVTSAVEDLIKRRITRVPIQLE
ncbi:xanthine dehydrogenase family protein molybdopterin-binding subunit [Metallosphaera tengchongensis]|uniref:Xanthine dehydrogenase family protein molybdopterin-binding subunit n=1 Tax=Metallosphaera tengchongensis TaxID=1532350 RepID=A0A6N0NWS8_9CREN|nr:xanthine dehydrogenase family protein molybdopterin-binding subunit [Metallosphaera tengchongensis]QKR00323.1 xanthine dehydrogenase family protein molybdopterin-binding subunit [Metallosphaera tengchongensis]